jgi:hypothetical protein
MADCPAHFEGRYGGELICTLAAGHKDHYHHDGIDGVHWAVGLEGAPGKDTASRFTAHVEEAIRDIPASCACPWVFDTGKWQWIRTDTFPHCPPHAIYKES